MGVNQDVIKKDKNEILPYIFTGIIKGKWKPEVEGLFIENHIDVDFSIRGFYDKQQIVRKRFYRKIIRLRLNKMISTLDLLNLKLKSLLS